MSTENQSDEEAGRSSGLAYGDDDGAEPLKADDTAIDRKGNESCCSRFKFLLKPHHGSSSKDRNKSFSIVILPETYYLYALFYFWFFWLVMIVSTLAFSDTYDPEHNPVKTRDGYNMICVYWDFTPATFISVPVFIPFLVIVTIFVISSSLRTYYAYKTEQMITPKAWKWFKASNIVMVVGFLLVPETLAVNPYESLVLHTIPYLCLLIALWLTNATQMYYYYKVKLFRSWEEGFKWFSWVVKGYPIAEGVIIFYMFWWALLNLIGMEVEALSFLHISKAMPWWVPIGMTIEVIFLLLVAVAPVVIQILIAPHLRNKCVKISFDTDVHHEALSKKE